MNAKHVLVYVAKLIIGAVVLFVGTMVGGTVARAVGLPMPTLPAGMDAETAGLYLMLASPLLAFGLALIAPGLSGNFLVRAGVLSLLMWIAYTVNTQLEASIFTAYATGFWFSVLSGLVAALFCGSAVALLFPAGSREPSTIAAVKEFFAHRSVGAWAWRLALGAVAFMPIYFGFGLLVVPFTSDYYRQNMFGLSMPTIDQILTILFVRSVLFLLACLPVVIWWQKSDRDLFWRLGLALFVLVGLVFMLISTWLPLYVRFPHSLEILADEFVYAGVLVLLLGKRSPAPQPRSQVLGKRMTA